MNRAPENVDKSQIRRIAIYLARMFPPWLLVPVGVAHFLAVFLTLQSLSNSNSLLLGFRAIGVALTVVLFSLLMRVFDELKDLQVDRQLADAGDPKFSNRPVVTGEVLSEDLVAIRNAVILLMIVVNLYLADPVVMIMFGLMFVVGWASSLWFFIPEGKRSLVVAFITHNPITVFVELYVVGFFVAEFGAHALNSWSILLIIGLWFPVSAWETSRKIRIPEDETDYETYSKVFGCRAAAMIPMFFVLASCLCLILVVNQAGLSDSARVIIIAGAALPIFACLLFVISPTRKRANLEPYTMCYAAISSLSLILGAWQERNLLWS